MPYGQQIDLQDSRDLVKTLGIKSFEVDIKTMVDKATQDVEYFYKDLTRSQQIIAKFSLHKLLHKLKDQYE